MTKEIHEINSNATDFVAELIDYIFTYPDDDYMTMECLCRKLHKYGLIDKQDGKYTADTPQTERIKTPDYCDICNHKECDNCIANSLDDYCVPSGYAPKDTPQTDCGWK